MFAMRSSPRDAGALLYCVNRELASLLAVASAFDEVE